MGRPERVDLRVQHRLLDAVADPGQSGEVGDPAYAVLGDDARK